MIMKLVQTCLYLCKIGTGHRLVLTWAGHKLVLTCTGYRFVSTWTSYRLVSTQTGHRFVLTWTGYRPFSTWTSYRLVPTQIGHIMHILVLTWTGHKLVLTQTGYRPQKVVLNDRLSLIRGPNVQKYMSIILQKWSLIRGQSLIKVVSHHRFHMSYKLIDMMNLPH